MHNITNNNNSETLTRTLLLLMSVTTGIAVASNYYAQPLLNTLAQHFNATKPVISLLITIAQVSYAFGLILLVPLGDVIERKRLIISMMSLSTLGLIICAISPNLSILFLGTCVAALFSVVAQVLVPYAATLANPKEKGKAISTMMNGLLVGILLARAWAGIQSSTSSWRSVYFIAAALMFIITIALAIRLPSYRATQSAKYHHLLGSIFTYFKTYPQLRLRAILGSLSFMIFSVLWTPMTFILGEQYHFSDMNIGLFSLAGIVSAFLAPLAGKLADRGYNKTCTYTALFLIIASWGPLYFTPISTVSLVAGIILSGIGMQFIQIINMSEIFKLEPQARNRLNAGYMFSYFLGGPIGTTASSLIYERYHWDGVCILGLSLSILALLIWIFSPQSAKRIAE